METERKRQPAPQQQQRAEGTVAQQQGSAGRKPAKSAKFIEQQGWRGDGVVGDSHTD